MNTIIVASTRPYTGKSGIVLALAELLHAAGRSAVYFKPYGTMPTTIDGVHTDLDAAYIARQIETPVPLDVVCPVVETGSFIEDVVAGRITDLGATVRAAFDQVAAGADTVLVEGPSDLYQGRSVGLSIAEVAELLEGRVLLVTPGERTHLPDDVICVADLLGDRLAGVLYNAVHPSIKDFVDDRAIPFLKQRGITGVRLRAARPVAGSGNRRRGRRGARRDDSVRRGAVDTTAESFMVGAMGQDKALRYFRRRPRKIVITGGDRADVQLAALETDTRAIVLTGDLTPSPIVLSRAEELGVPMILVQLDTLSAVERLEGLFGRMRIHDPMKAARIREMLSEAVDTEDC
jgi:uncharacterized protein